MFIQIYKVLSNFDSNSLICDPTPFPGKKSPNIAKSNCVFPMNGRGDRDLILTYLDRQIAEVFPTTAYLFQYRPSSGGNGRSKWDQKCKLWIHLFFMKTQLLQIFFKQCFWFAKVLPLVRLSAILEHILESKYPKTSQKGPFNGCWLVRKTLKAFNLTASNAILMKLTTIMYLHESVNRKPLRARNSFFWRNVYEFLDYIKNHYICHA